MKFTEEKIQFAGNIKFAGSDDEGEKELIGKVWDDKSGNLFCIVWKKDGNGNSVSQQVNKTIEAQK